MVRLVFSVEDHASFLLCACFHPCATLQGCQGEKDPPAISPAWVDTHRSEHFLGIPEKLTLFTLHWHIAQCLGCIIGSADTWRPCSLLLLEEQTFKADGSCYSVWKNVVGHSRMCKKEQVQYRLCLLSNQLKCTVLPLFLSAS